MDNHLHFGNRHSIRLEGYDYSQNGAYFITLCTQNKSCLFGNIVYAKMILNDAGRMIKTIWDEIQLYYPGIETGEFIIMPNHIHGIINLVGPAPTKKLSLPDVIGRFKTMTTNKYICGVKQNGWHQFSQKLWQRNYHEHIIRDANESDRIQQYITDNPEHWENDKNYYDNNNPIISEQQPIYNQEPWML